VQIGVLHRSTPICTPSVLDIVQEFHVDGVQIGVLLKHFNWSTPICTPSVLDIVQEFHVDGVQIGVLLKLLGVLQFALRLY